jgi:hypothetical protein
MRAHGPSRPFRQVAGSVDIGRILLQKSKVARRLIFREITKREAIADSYSRAHISEVACVFNVGR